MSVSDFIADQMTIVRNAVMAKKKDVTIKRSNVMEGIVDIMKKEGFIEDYQVIEDSKQGKIKIYLKWLEDGTSVLEKFEKVSTPGMRRYISAKDVVSVMGGAGFAIYSTSKGLLTDREAKVHGVGGELICRVW